jgi:hypothetical protein
VEQNEIHTIRPDEHTIHGLFLTNSRGAFQMIVAIETFDNQLDFNILVLKEKPSASGFSYELRQLREIEAREDKFDPIQKAVILVDKEQMVIAQTLRQSGKVDFYYTGNRVGTYSPDPMA